MRVRGGDADKRPQRRRTVAWRAGALSALAAVSISASVSTTPAVAGADSYCPGTSVYMPSGQNCYGPNHSLRRAQTTHQGGSTTVVGAGADTTVGTRYGSIVYNPGFVCHSYAGTTVLYPLGQNGGAFNQYISGYSTWGTGAQICL